jgi:UDP-N-acetyl-D-mannosaminuronic acid dehydrogenase
MKKITVVGLGYMGLPTALFIARSGKFEVSGYDISAEKIDCLKKGILPFEEKGLKELWDDAKNNFRPVEKLEKSDIFLLALPTPATKDKRCNTDSIESAVDLIIPLLGEGNLVILESTVAPGTTNRIFERMCEKSGKNLAIGYVSEKAIPGDTLNEMVNNDRIIGVSGDAGKELIEQVYNSFVKGKLYFTDTNTAESVKLMENAFRDVNIALANEFARICDEIGVNAYEAIELANKHPRVNILQPGPGVGGHCIAIDPWFLVQNTKSGELIRTARGINDGRPNDVIAKVKKLVKGIDNPKISVLGLAYKKDVDDDRESPSYAIIEGLKREGYEVSAHDPHVKNKEFNESLEECLHGSDCVVLATDHSSYMKLDFSKYRVNGGNIIDTRGLWQNQELKKRGYDYII